MIIYTKSLNFYFSRQQVIKSLSLEVPENSIYGFLGRNGAGKTITIKLLLNLLQAQKGDIYIFEKELQTNRIEILSQIGALVEQPVVYLHMTGRENLLNKAAILGVSRQRVEEMLELVHLNQDAHKKAGKYSLGMKQRLGIALALLSDPKLLILDEPTNGLDPNGIIEMRELLRDLVTKHNKTIFLSSHLIAEIERIATHVGIIDNGELLFQGNVQELEKIGSPMITLETDRLEDAKAFLKNAGYTVSDPVNNYLDIPFVSKEQISEISNLLILNGYKIYSIYKKHKDLEKLFLSITNTEQL